MGNTVLRMLLSLDVSMDLYQEQLATSTAVHQSELSMKISGKISPGSIF